VSAGAGSAFTQASLARKSREEEWRLGRPDGPRHKLLLAPALPERAPELRDLLLRAAPDGSQ